MLRWYGDKVYAGIVADARAKVTEAALLTERTVKSSMRLGGRTLSGKAVKKAGTKDTMVDPLTGKEAENVGTYASLPGEVPRVQTGTLRRGYTHETDPMLPIARAGTNVKYAKWLEFGTRRMKPRPHVRPALERLRSAFTAIFNRPIKPTAGSAR